jgi:hypothetical protein
LSSGTIATTYIITLEDANGHAVAAPAAETFDITDNAMTGDAYLVSGSTATLIPQSGTLASVTMSAGSTQVEFTVVNTLTQSSPATLTITAASGDVANGVSLAPLSATAQAPYAFVTGPAEQVALSGPTVVAENKTATYTAQVEDSSTNPVPDNGATVTFTLSGSSSAMFSNGSTTMAVPLNSAGAATVTVDSGASAGTYTVIATVSPAVSVFTSAVTATVTSPGATVAELSVSGNTTTLAGLGSATISVTEENAVASPISAIDNLQVSVSNNDLVLATSGGTIQSGTTLTLSGVSASSTTDTLSFEVFGGSAGTATVTITDTSDPSVPPVSFTVAVQPLSSKTLSAAPESGAGNVAGDTASVTINGSSATADYATNWEDFATYNAQNGELTVLTPVIASGTVYSGTSAVSTGDVAVWEVGGKYYYVALDETPGTGAAASTDYVGIGITVPVTGATLQMAINNGSYDGNTSSVDYAYVAIATENSNGTWSVAPAQSFVLNNQVSFSSAGPTVVYPMLIQQP